VSGLPFGHVQYNAALPFGGIGALDGKKGDLFVQFM
jgi:muramoyltetrapeptide carboxypeptidase LdcA involved in peptidoglycan recycling